MIFAIYLRNSFHYIVFRSAQTMVQTLPDKPPMVGLILLPIRNRSRFHICSRLWIVPITVDKTLYSRQTGVREIQWTRHIHSICVLKEWSFRSFSRSSDSGSLQVMSRARIFLSSFVLYCDVRGDALLKILELSSLYVRWSISVLFLLNVFDGLET